MRQRRPKKAEEKSADIKRARHRALHILERSDRTEQELRSKLLQSYQPEAVEDAVSYVKRYHYLDDTRYAVNYLNSRGRVKSRRQVEQELLYKKGIAQETLEEALELANPQDEREQIRRWIEKKQIRPETAGREELRRFYLFLMRRGFQSEDILSELQIRDA